ncbi:MAG: ribose 5-phosphate isomerase B [candidate division KSB1 bacterium]|jgi:ribose 5-phosphate isomerase B|nr:ribose 5-phosphate isomerase B [candidate division KSB1 bacterium]
MRIAIACDHAGYCLKNNLIKHLKKSGHNVQDFGCSSSDSCDYPDYAYPAAQSVADGDNDRGILICSNGIGMCMVANRVPGITGALVYSLETAETTRKHHNSNVLCLGAKEFSENELVKMVDIWLETAFDGGRHERRMEKVTAPDRNSK